MAIAERDDKSVTVVDSYSAELKGGDTPLTCSLTVTDAAVPSMDVESTTRALTSPKFERKVTDHVLPPFSSVADCVVCVCVLGWGGSALVDKFGLQKV